RAAVLQGGSPAVGGAVFRAADALARTAARSITRSALWRSHARKGCGDDWPGHIDQRRKDHRYDHAAHRIDHRHELTTRASAGHGERYRDGVAGSAAPIAGSRRYRSTDAEIP